MRISDDGLVYVCDRTNDRIQVFRKDGTFVKEAFIAKRTLGSGSVWDIGFSTDPAQTYLIVNDGTNQQIWMLRRDTLESLGAFGPGGALGRAVLRRARPGRGLEGQSLHRRNLRRQARAEVRLPRAGIGDRAVDSK